jgi:hypothetical protein
MAEFAECSPATIQAIELGKLKISDRIARLVFVNTGVSLEWLLANDTSVPPTDHDTKEPLSKDTFEAHRAGLFAPNRGDTKALGQLFDLWTLYARQVDVYSILLAEAYKKNREGLFAYKCMMATLEVSRALEDIPDLGEKLIAGEAPVSHERINDALGFVRRFAEDTYAHFREKVARSSAAPDANLKKIIQSFDKTLRYRPEHPLRKK